ncbi:MAG: UDP-N-acetylmuramoyl-L-alanine--D-glutamate ligase [Patescibacteria group bacterium]
MNARAHLEGKKITVMGLGLLGRGVGDARYLAEQGAELIITDLKTKEELSSSLQQLSGFPNITYVLGEHRLEDFQNRDFILKAAGVPLDSPYIQEAEKHHISIKMSASWFMELSGIPVIGVTGTRGKSTTTHMIHSILMAARVPVLLGGNVRGVSTLALLDEATPQHHALFELDSWQCQGFGNEKMSPQIAVFTTFMPDHMNYYKDDMEVYLRDKANIFLYQKPDDTLVLGSQCAEVVQDSYSERMVGKTVVASEHDVPDDWQLKIPGQHNRYDAGLALATARVLGIPDTVSRSALETFAGVPGRLELVRTVNGVDFYNDTTATTPDATLAAVRALPAGRTILLMGGADKGLNMTELIREIPTLTKQVLLLQGTGTSRIRTELPSAPVYETMQAALTAAVETAEDGDTVLLSPAFASFGMFKNEYDRGDQFTAIVEAL